MIYESAKTETTKAAVVITTDNVRSQNEGRILQWGLDTRSRFLFNNSDVIVCCKDKDMNIKVIYLNPE